MALQGSNAMPELPYPTPEAVPLVTAHEAAPLNPVTNPEGIAPSLEATQPPVVAEPSQTAAEVPVTTEALAGSTVPAPEPIPATDATAAANTSEFTTVLERASRGLTEETLVELAHASAASELPGTQAA